MTTPEPHDLAPPEGKLAPAYAETMDYVSRCAQALEDGNWDYLADKACQLRNHAIQLERAADAAKAAGPPPRAAAVLAAIAARAARMPRQVLTITKHSHPRPRRSGDGFSLYLDAELPADPEPAR